MQYHNGMTPDIKRHVIDIVTAAPQLADSWVRVHTNDSGVKRRAYLDANRHLSAFQAGTTDNVWLIMPGLRGIGKTTIIAQMYHELSVPANRKFFVSLERIKTVGGDVNQVIAVIEELIGMPLEGCNEPLFFFFDEVQYFEDWALILKTVVDRTPKLFMVCTGSSAIQLQTDANIVRRSTKIPVHPLCFTEYVMIKQAHIPDPKSVQYPIDGLARNIREAIFQSKDALEAYGRLRAFSADVTSYWKGLPPQEYVNEYLKFGTLPFTLKIPEELLRWQRITQLLNESLARDIAQLDRFDSDTVSRFTRLLFLLANSDTISLRKVAEALQIDPKTVMSALDTLKDTEIITPILPKGSAYKQVRRPAKYVFTSPAMRAALSNSGGVLDPTAKSELRGRLLEDIVGMYLKRIFLTNASPAAVEYDYTIGGADFVVSTTGLREDSIPLEVGSGRKTARQALKTLEALNGKYGVVVSDVPLHVEETNRVVFVPFTYFLLA